MPIKKGDIVITGTGGGVNCYITRGGRNIVRAASPLTGARVKKDPAFAGFRKSSNRMKVAAPIAASLYNQIPKEKKEFSLYRMLTGEAIKMIKDGIDAAIILQTLQDKYIAPVLATMTFAEECSDFHSGFKRQSIQHTQHNLAIDPFISIQPPKERLSSSCSNLIYLSRFKGHRKLKIWLRPNG